MENIYDIIILGGGPAGYTAALYSARAGFNTMVIEQMAAGGQMMLTGDIDNYPGFDQSVDGFTLGMKMQSGAERFGAKTEYTQVTGVDFSQKVKKIETLSGEFFSRAVIVATGANPRELGIKGESDLIGMGVHYCAHCDGRFYKDKIVAVIGGGNSAVADALYLSRLAKKVYLVHRRDSLRATKIYHEPLKNAPNVEFVWNSVVKEFDHNGSMEGVIVENVITKEEAKIFCDGVFVSIGRKPATDFLIGHVELDGNGYIIANENCKTNVDGVFVAGDVRTKELRQIITAASDGAVAADTAEKYLTEN